MTYALPLTRRQERALDKIARCPSCGAWAMWPSIAHYLEAELDPDYCHHGHEKEEVSAAWERRSRSAA